MVMPKLNLSPEERLLHNLKVRQKYEAKKRQKYIENNYREIVKEILSRVEKYDKISDLEDRIVSELVNENKFHIIKRKEK